VLDDGVLREQTRERFDRVMAAKSLGAWHLHELTQDDALDWFVLFSSAAALLGSPGQGNYAAANAFLDGLAHHRRAENLPALSVNWGSWSEVGMAARLKDREGKRLSALGLGWIDPAHGLETLEHLMADQRVQAAVIAVDWPKFFARIPAGSEPAWLKEMSAEARAGSIAVGPPVLLEKLQEITPGERLETALEFLQRQAGRVLAVDEGELPDPRRSLNELGFDSLTAVEFCNRVSQSVAQTLNPTLLFDYPTLELLAGYVVRDMLQMETGSDDAVEDETEQAEDAEKEVREQVLDEIADMSDEEMESLVAEQLKSLE